jgi:Taurine catabolism dioxygenase TauD, TfdA family
MAKQGGESGICSAHTVWNELRKKEPDVLKTLTAPIWYVDRKGEVTEGQDPWIKTAIFLLEPSGKRRIYIK